VDFQLPETFQPGGELEKALWKVEVNLKHQRSRFRDKKLESSKQNLLRFLCGFDSACSTAELELERLELLEDQLKEDERLRAEKKQQLESHMDRIERLFRALAMLVEKLLEALLFFCNFSEFPNKYRPPCTTMPWNIRPALLVLWGVCWMFFYHSSTGPRTGEPSTASGTSLPFANLNSFPYGNSFQCRFRLTYNKEFCVDSQEPAPSQHPSYSFHHQDNWFSQEPSQTATAPPGDQLWDSDSKLWSNAVFSFQESQSLEQATANDLLQQSTAASSQYLIPSNLPTTFPTAQAAMTQTTHTLAPSETPTTPDLPVQLPQDSEVRLTCNRDGCDNVTFQRRSAWQTHKDKHDRPFKCDVAGCTHSTGFSSKGILDRHKRTIHKLLPPDKSSTKLSTLVLYYCPEPSCHRSISSSPSNPFTRKDNLNEHIRRKHGDLQPKTSTGIMGDSDPMANSQGLSLPNESARGGSAEAVHATMPSTGKRRRLESGPSSLANPDFSSRSEETEDLKRKIKHLEGELETYKKTVEKLVGIIGDHMK
jgi:hypothetical protein